MDPFHCMIECADARQNQSLGTGNNRRVLCDYTFCPGLENHIPDRTRIAHAIIYYRYQLALILFPLDPRQNVQALTAMPGIKTIRKNRHPPTTYPSSSARTSAIEDAANDGLSLPSA
jgi:hypothetical protein